MAGRRPDQAAVAAADADRVVAVHVDRGDELRVDLADEHHAGDVDGLGVGDPQAVAELGRLAEPRHQRGDLRSAAVDDDRAHPDEPHQHDVLRRTRRARRGRTCRRSRCRRTSRRRSCRRSAGCTAAPRPASPPVRDGRLGSRSAHGMTPTLREAGGLVESERDVGGLQRPAGRTLGEVVDRAQRHDVAGAFVVAGGDVRRVRAERRLRRRRRRRSRRRTARRRRPLAKSASSDSVDTFASRGRPGVAGGEDPPVHRREVRREQDRALCSGASRFCSISGVWR